MIIKDLIEELKKIDSNKVVKISANDGLDEDVLTILNTPNEVIIRSYKPDSNVYVSGNENI